MFLNLLIIKVLTSPRQGHHTMLGRFINLLFSPEVWKDGPYTMVSDIWSLGCVLYEILALKPPFQANDMEGLYKKVLKG